MTDESTRPWEQRRDGEPTMEYLGRVLEEYVQLADLAKRARRSYYDDFFAPPEVADGLEILRLVADLRSAARGLQLSGQRDRARKVLVMVDATKDGEFDATREESDAWAKSEDGQRTLAKLLEGR